MKSGNDQKEGKNTTTGIELASTASFEGNEGKRSSEDPSNAEVARDVLASLAQGGRMQGGFSRPYTPPMAVERPLPVIDHHFPAPYFDLQSAPTEPASADATFLFGLPMLIDLNFSSVGSSPMAAPSFLPPRRPGVTPNLENGNGSIQFFYPPALDDISSSSVGGTPSSGSRPPPVTPSHANSDPAMLNVLPSKSEEAASGIEDNFALSPRGEGDNWVDPIDSSFGQISRAASKETTSSTSSRENVLGVEPPPASGSATSLMENAIQYTQGLQSLPEEGSAAGSTPRKLGGATEFSMPEDF